MVPANTLTEEFVNVGLARWGVAGVVNGLDGTTDGGDLGIFFAEWGRCGDCRADFDGSGVIDGVDLGMLFVAWGPCS